MRVTRVRAIEQKTYWQSEQGHQNHEWLSSTFLSLQNWRPILLPEHDYCVADCSWIQWMSCHLSFRTSYSQTVLAGKWSEREFSERQAASAVVPAHVWSLFAFTAWYQWGEYCDQHSRWLGHILSRSPLILCNDQRCNWHCTHIDSTVQQRHAENYLKDSTQHTSWQH